MPTVSRTILKAGCVDWSSCRIKGMSKTSGRGCDNSVRVTRIMSCRRHCGVSGEVLPPGRVHAPGKRGMRVLDGTGALTLILGIRLALFGSNAKGIAASQHQKLAMVAPLWHTAVPLHRSEPQLVAPCTSYDHYILG
jgi:hypothetical protein